MDRNALDWLFSTLTKTDYSQLREINKVRNLMLYEVNIQKVDNEMDKRLQEITEKLKAKCK